MEDILQLLPFAETQDKPFRINNQKMMLTYASHIDKETFKEWIRATFTSYVPRDVIIAHEIGAEEYAHTHVLIDWNKGFQSRNCRVFDYSNIHPNIQLIKTKKHWDNSIQYMAKQDPENAHLLVKSSIIDGICNHDTPLEMLKANIKETKDISMALNLLKIYEYKNNVEVKIPEITFQWQIDLAEELNNITSEYRKIIWMYDNIGNTGKTMFAKHMSLSNPTKYVTTTTVGGQYHLATLIQGCRDDGWDGHCLIIDIARDHKERDSIYGALEAIKNGMITTQKYRGKTLYFDNNIVVIMANFVPNIHRMSLDRWDIRQIIDKEQPAVRLTLEEADCLRKEETIWI